MLILIPTTTITIVGNQLIQDSLSDIEWICSNEEAVHCRQQPSEPAPSAAPPQEGAPPGLGRASSAAGLTNLYDTTLRTVRIWQRFRLLAVISGQPTKDLNTAWERNRDNLISRDKLPTAE